MNFGLVGFVTDSLDSPHLTCVECELGVSAHCYSAPIGPHLTWVECEHLHSWNILTDAQVLI